MWAAEVTLSASEDDVSCHDLAQMLIRHLIVTLIESD
jgi:hypothetical protein